MYRSSAIMFKSYGILCEPDSIVMLNNNRIAIEKINFDVDGYTDDFEKMSSALVENVRQKLF